MDSEEPPDVSSSVTPNNSDDTPKDEANPANGEEEQIDEEEDDANVVTISSGESDTEAYTNPEPPKEILEQRLLGADTIGNTVFSKHWLFMTLMKLIEAVDKEPVDSPDDSNVGLDLEESLQDELCKLWDMSMNAEVVSFLMEFKAIDLLSGVISKSKAPRAIEICIGILGNMACTDNACIALSRNEKLRSLVLLLLGSPDAPTLVETTRMLNICVSSSQVSELWVTAVKDSQPVFECLVFMLQSSTNVDLLTNVADIIDKIMDMEDELLMRWSTIDLVQAILEAVKQCGSRKDAIDTFLHILQLVSTCEPGVEALGYHSEELCQLTLQYLTQLCSEDIIVLEGQEDAIGSALSVLASAFTAVDDKSGLLSKDFQMMRCLVKLLGVVYPKLRSFTPPVGLRTQRSRSDSKCSESEGQRSRTASGENKTESGENLAGDSNADKEQTKSSEEGEKVDSDNKVDSSNPATGDDENQKSPEITKVQPTSSSANDSGVVEMLYEVLQNILTDVILVLSEEDALESETSATESPEHAESSDEPKPSKSSEKPLSLLYLNDHCERTRLKILVHTLDEVLEDTELDCCSRLRQVAQNHGFSRLERIVEQYSAG